MSPALINAILVGWSSPVTWVLTMRLSSSIVGEGANGWMKVVIVAELLLVSKSVSTALAVAVLMIDPVADGVTTMVTTAVAPTVRFPNAQFTVPVPLHEPCEGVAETKLTPEGSVSLMLTFVARAGPLLDTVTR